MRLRLDSYPIVDSEKVRYADLDSNAHVNNLALESMHENARALMNRHLIPDIYDIVARRLRLVTSQNAVHFLAEVHWPAVVQTGAGVGRIGRTSFVASTGLFVDGTCVGVCDTVLVLLDDNGPTPLPDNNRAAMQALMLG
ncbi:acyl-CoA thioesterase [Mycolicibacterium sp. CH28]|nr:acyl-CoA thioesterase [Mycolicibacterium sp. CH28]